jgi:hypothetical protein
VGYRTLAGVVAALTIPLAGSLVGCARTVDGTAHTQQTGDAASGTATSQAPLVTESGLTELLPWPKDVAAALHAPDVDIVRGYVRVEPMNDGTLSDPGCFGAVLATTEPAYRGSGYLAVRGQLLQEPTQDYTHRVDEAVVGFGSADEASKFVSSQADAWWRCSSRSLTWKSNGKDVNWLMRTPTETDGVVAMFRIEEGGAGWACSHAMGARSNVVADVMACAQAGPELNDQVIALVKQITGKVPK